MDLTGNWILKAESDLKIGKDEIVTEAPATDAICFHMQQCVEKYIKAFLVYRGKDFRKTHVLGELIHSAMEEEDSFKELYEFNADTLTIYATQVRYPDDFYMPTIPETEECIIIAEKAREFIRNKLDDSGYTLPQ